MAAFHVAAAGRGGAGNPQPTPERIERLLQIFTRGRRALIILPQVQTA